MNRLQSYISQSGYCSRRKAAELIEERKVKIDGIVCLQPWKPISPEQTIEVQGVNVRPKKRQLYLALHKPPGYLTTNSDPHGRPCAIDLVQPIYQERLFHVGRLDKNSSGLLFFTNDGYFAQDVLHPSKIIEKEYEVKTRKSIPEFVMQHWMRGIEIEGQRYKLQAYQMLGSRQVKLVLTEGLNREIRRVFEHFHIPLKRVHRLRIGNVRLHGLAPGEFRPIKDFEIKGLKNSRSNFDAPHKKDLREERQRSSPKTSSPHSKQSGLYNTPSSPYTKKQTTSKRGQNLYGLKNSNRRRPQLSRTQAATQKAPRAARPQRKRPRHT